MLTRACFSCPAFVPSRDTLRLQSLRTCIARREGPWCARETEASSTAPVVRCVGVRRTQGRGGARARG